MAKYDFGVIWPKGKKANDKRPLKIGHYQKGHIQKANTQEGQSDPGTPESTPMFTMVFSSLVT